MPEPVGRRPSWDTLDRLEGLEKLPAGHPWQGLVNRLARRLRPSGRDREYELSLCNRVRAPVGGVFPIAVLNFKGGVGKTAVVEALGSTFAHIRDDRVLAVDLGGGDLADRHGNRNPLSLLDLVADAAAGRYVDIGAYTWRNRAGLELLTCPDYAASDGLVGRDDFVKAFSLLRRHYSVALIDCAYSLAHGAIEAVLRESRALVVVTSISAGAARKTGTTLKWLRASGHQRLGESAVLAINRIEGVKPNTLAATELKRLASQFPPQRVVVLPFDRHVHEGRAISLERLSNQSRRRYLEMAAALASAFPQRN